MARTNETVAADIEGITALVIDRAQRGDPLSPSGVVLLVRQYRAGRTGVDEVLGDGLARAVDRRLDDQTTIERARWVTAFAEATTVSEDPRLADAARAAIETLVGEWPSLTIVDEAGASIDACLSASALVERRTLVGSGVDELERIVAAAYRPGFGIAHTIEARAHERGGVADHVRMASALLTAFDLTGRLPYSMLAEELIQSSRPALLSTLDFAVGCDASRVVGRLARLHADADYRGAAVMATSADYRADASRILARLPDQLRGADADAALYALALQDQHT
jgi:uncharacterized protein YyaL (SSP411 family)